MCHATNSVVVRRKWIKADTVHRNRDFREHRGVSTRVLPGNNHIHEGAQHDRKGRCIDTTWTSNTEAVVPDTEIENRAIVVGVFVKQGDECISIPKVVVQSFDLYFQSTCRKRTIVTQCISQLASITGIRINNNGDIVCPSWCAAHAIDGNHQLSCGAINR